MFPHLIVLSSVSQTNSVGDMKSIMDRACLCLKSANISDITNNTPFPDYFDCV